MINEEIREHHSVSGQIVVNLFENLLISIQRDITTFSRSSPIPEKFLKLKHELETQFAQPVRLKQLAARVGLSVPHFCFEFKRHFGVSAIDYVIQLRLHQASFLLKNRNRTVADIAAEVGYEDLYYFSKLYKKYYGYSPRSIRKL
ncbi:helix-turn-helix transcriptional regulator [Geitlerinema calcuttense]|uniref:helix-turn-helix transcriptional regulator n=1 Tax=Geitlerinema calcuttense TaxID=1471433 RepID=UPI00255B958B|nr:MULTISPECIES: AraC family transcriptional regulator [Cyanophyceae]MDL5054371.1 AraC family transcriptional regulator [Oscillatoria laete-virens NRMC-F 0139]